MSGASVGCSQPRPCSGRKTLRRCGNRGETDNVVLIDVDGDRFENVIVIDVPESLTKKFRGGTNAPRKGGKCKSTWTTVICLDDDENTADTSANSGVKSDGNFDNSASSSRRSCPTTGNLGKFSGDGEDECEFVRENVPPVKLSKGKRTYSGKTPARNRYGLDTDSESSSSDSDFPDCVLMEDSLGRVKEQWEKASWKRKCDGRNGQSSCEDPGAGFSDAYCGQHKDSKDDKRSETPAASVPKKKNLDYTSDDPGMGIYDEGDDYIFESVLKDNFCYKKDNHQYGIDSVTEQRPFDSAQYQSGQNCEPGGSSSYAEEKQGPERSSSFPCHEQGTSQLNHVERAFQDRVETSPSETCVSEPESWGQKFCHGKANLSTSKCNHSMNCDLDHGRLNSEEKFWEKTSSSNPCFPQDPRHDNDNSEEKLASEDASFPNTRSSDKNVSNGFTSYSDKYVRVPVETFLHENSESGMQSSRRKDCHLEHRGEIHDNPSVSSNVNFKVQLGQEHLSLLNGEDEPVKSMDNKLQEIETIDPVHDKNGLDVLNIEGCIISGREKLKETDEYKKATEEEWASRQRALQIQAEEAQQLRRLRKRRKAESMRLLDMERRQKQRVEEIRETQKKDEENMNLKEVIRAEVRKELNELELRCFDMASLLRGLGILVTGGLCPSLDEVRSAYKRALLTFHPDRSSRSDIRQQVEAEEKFKLISRMKEKLLPT